MRTSPLLFLLFVTLTLCGTAHFSGAQDAAGGSAATHPLLLVVNQGDKNISVVDPATARQIATISEELSAVHGHEIAVSPHGQLAFVPIYGSSGVGLPGIDGREMLVIDIATRKIIGKVDFGKGVRPHCVVYEPVSNLLYVTTELANSITIVNPLTLKIVGEIPTTQPQSHMLAISHDGRRGYTANVSPGSVSVLDIAARKTIAVIPISANTQRIAISNDDKLVFTADQTKPQLAVIDTATNSIKTWVPLPSTGYGAAATRDGHWLLVAMDGGVAVVDLGTLKIARTIPVGGDAQEIITSPDGKSAYVSYHSGKQTGRVAEIDLAEWKVKNVIEAGAGADGLAWVPAS